MNKQTKFHGLDALRGIAAIMVVFQHLWETTHIADDRLRPWLFFCAGHEAVILFFVLSGFVLSHQLRNFSFNAYKAFIMKRFIRIYPAYYLSIFASALLLLYINKYHRSTLSGNNLSNWFYIWSQTQFDFTFWKSSLTILAHCGNSLNLSVWTLFYEMWLSLAFPIIHLLLKTRVLIFRYVFIGMLSGLSYYLWQKGTLLKNDWAGIIYYSWYFIVGAMLYNLRDKVSWLATKQILALGLMLYFSNYLFFGKITSRLIHEVIIAGGSSLIILNSIHNNQFKQILAYPLLQFYGRISYSLYLLHLPILYAISYLYINTIGITGVKVLTLVFASSIAWFCYYLIEDKFTDFLKTKFKLG